MSKKLISVVLPSYNEEKNISLAYDEILNNIDTKKYDYELIFVNDGSRDNTWGEIVELSKTNRRVHGINFSRNFGHHAALQAGIEAARGGAVIMMDADLQQPPSLIPTLLSKWEEGFEIVVTVRKSTENATIFKMLTAKIFYKILNNLSDLQLNEGEADFRLMDRKALDALNAMPETPKFYRGLVNWIGYKTVRVPYVAVARRHGRSSYTLKKMIELARLGLTSFSMKPLKFIISFGAILSLSSLLMLFVMLGVKLFIDPYYFSNNAILVMFLIFIAGMLSTFQGVVAIYLVDIFEASKGRPAYLISRTTEDE